MVAAGRVRAVCRVGCGPGGRGRDRSRVAARGHCPSRVRDPRVDVEHRHRFGHAARRDTHCWIDWRRPAGPRRVHGRRRTGRTTPAGPYDTGTRPQRPRVVAQPSRTQQRPHNPRDDRIQAASDTEPDRVHHGARHRARRSRTSRHRSRKSRGDRGDRRAVDRGFQASRPSTPCPFGLGVGGRFLRCPGPFRVMATGWPRRGQGARVGW